MEERLTLPTDRNLNLSAVFHFPSKSVKYPAVIVLHGFAGHKDEEHIVGLCNDLQKQQICAIRFDMSGLGESEGSIENDYRFSHYLKDIDAIYYQLSKQYFIDNESIGIVGHCMGGEAALLYAAMNQKIRSVCAISAPPSLPDAAAFKNDLKEWRRTGWHDHTSARFGILSFPYAFIKDAMKHDVRKVVKNIKQPKLLVWGTKDKNVLPTECEELFDFLDDPKEQFVVSGMDHHYKRDAKLIAKVDNRVVAFFQETL